MRWIQCQYTLEDVTKLYVACLHAFIDVCTLRLCPDQYSNPGVQVRRMLSVTYESVMAAIASSLQSTSKYKARLQPSRLNKSVGCYALNMEPTLLLELYENICYCSLYENRSLQLTLCLQCTPSCISMLTTGFHVDNALSQSQTSQVQWCSAQVGC